MVVVVLVVVLREGSDAIPEIVMLWPMQKNIINEIAIAAKIQVTLFIKLFQGTQLDQ